MTPLSKAVRRRVPAPRRDLVVSILPGGGSADLVEVREFKRRKGFSISIASLYMLLARREADRLVLEKRAARKAKSLARKLERRGGGR